MKELVLILTLFTEYDTSLVSSNNAKTIFNAYICDNIRSVVSNESINTPIDNSTFSYCYTANVLDEKQEYSMSLELFIGLVWAF